MKKSTRDFLDILFYIYDVELEKREKESYQETVSFLWETTLITAIHFHYAITCEENISGLFKNIKEMLDNSLEDAFKTVEGYFNHIKKFTLKNLH